MGSSHRDRDSKKAHKEHKAHKSHKEHKEHKERKEHKEHKEHREHKSHKEKDHKRSKEPREEKREKRDGERSSRPSEPIGPDDFFLKSQEFRAWLWLSQKRRFEDLSSVEARALFSDRFVPQFNEGALDGVFYSGQCSRREL